MHRILASLLLSGVGLAALAIPAGAQGTTRHAGSSAAHTHASGPQREHLSSSNTTQVNWAEHDTAVYVVSTLNLLHAQGKTLPALLAARLNVTHYDVYADQSANNLYFVELKQDDGTVVGVFAYMMGWARPQVVSLSSKNLNQRKASDQINSAFHKDTKVLIGSFTSTLPA